MNDWVSCDACRTIYEYDPALVECPYCSRLQDEVAIQPAEELPTLARAA